MNPVDAVVDFSNPIESWLEVGGEASPIVFAGGIMPTDYNTLTTVDVAQAVSVIRFEVGEPTFRFDSARSVVRFNGSR